MNNEYYLGGNKSQAYISYKVISSVSAQGYRQGQHTVIRRFRDFSWLKSRLRSCYKGAIVPALPEKNVLEKYKMTDDFIEARRIALGVFLRRVAAHPLLSDSADLRLFLQADETEFAIESSRLSAEMGDVGKSSGTVAQKTFNTAAKLLRKFALSTGTVQSTIQTNTSRHGRLTSDAEESSEYLKIRAYFWELESHLAEAHKQAEKLIRQQTALSNSLADFGNSLSVLARLQQLGNEDVPTEGTDSTVQALKDLETKASMVSKLYSESSHRLLRAFEAPMKEFMRSVRSAKKAMEERAEALAARERARAEVDAHRARLTRIRNTPGMKEERVMEAERDLQTALTQADAESKTYLEIVQRMDTDLVRFQRERVQEMELVLQKFAIAEASMAGEMAQIWGRSDNHQ